MPSMPTEALLDVNVVIASVFANDGGESKLRISNCKRAPKARNVIAWANGPGWLIIEMMSAEGAE
jgi:hypothetical protein